MSGAFADDDKKKKTFEEMCAKKKGNSPDALFCQAILGLQQSTNSFFDIFTELSLVDTDLQTQIDSFFDIFVELDDVASQQCPQGQVATGTNLDGSLLCTDMTQYQRCPQGQVVVGIDANGEIICEVIPSQTPVDGTPCNDNNSNTINDVYLGGVCRGTPLGIECVNGQSIDEQVIGDCQEILLCQDGQEVSIPDNADLPSSSSCSVGICTAGVPSSVYSPAGTACSESGGSICDGAGSCVATDVCGDGIVTGSEQCDGADLGSLSCLDFGYDTGVLSCTSSCTINEANCRFVDTCPGGPPCP